MPPPPAYGQVDVAGRTMKVLRNVCSIKLLSYATSAADDERLLQKHSLSFGEAALDKLRLWEKCALAACVVSSSLCRCVEGALYEP